MSPLIFIIFGATGDLTARKLMPAMYSLYAKGQLPKELFVLGVGRRELSNGQFQDMMKTAVEKYLKPNGNGFDSWAEFAQSISYTQGNFEDPSLYRNITGILESFDTKIGACIPRFFYLATPPDHYETILTHLRDSKLSLGCFTPELSSQIEGKNVSNFTRVLIEKPFGKDLDTARRLDQLLGTIFEERQIYRIDHYLAKETLQNILAFRFANGIFEPTWNKDFIDHVQISMAEDVGIEARGNFYEGIGALRDVVQNHLMQMLSLIAMEQPNSFDAQSVRDERTHVVTSVEYYSDEVLQDAVVRGQYEGYSSEPGVQQGSQTETFVAMKVLLDLPRWKGVPFYLRTGKKLGSKVTEISIHYKKPALCNDDVCLFDPEKVLRNVLTIRVTPNEQIALRLMIKQPGYGMQVTPVHMDFSYAHDLPGDIHLDAYETLLLDTVAGDQMRFARTDEIEASWQVVKPILDAWQSNTLPLLTYKEGTHGPAEADALLEKDGRKWYLHDK